MTNPFSPTTLGGSAGQFTYNDLVGIQTNQTKSTTLSRAEKYEAKAQEKVNNYTTTTMALDKNALTIISNINFKKQQILTIISNAYSASGGASAPSGTFKSKASAQADTTAAKVVYAAGITTFSYDCTILPPITCQVGAVAPMYPDILTAWNYPNVEYLDVSAQLYKQDEDYVTVTNSNLGIGVTAYEFGDAAGVTGFIGLVTTSNSSLGNYYFFTNIDSVLAGSSSSITSLITDIETLRNQVNSFIKNSTGTDKIRKLKSDVQVKLWFEKKGQQTVPTSDYAGGLSDLETNQDIIQNYNG